MCVSVCVCVCVCECVCVNSTDGECVCVYLCVRCGYVQVFSAVLVSVNLGSGAVSCRLRILLKGGGN